MSEERTAHWDAVHGGCDATEVSWYQAVPALSLELVDLLGVPPQSVVIDVGGGSSSFAGSLLARGFSDITVLDVSAVALERSRLRIGDGAGVSWVCGDLLSWRPQRVFGLWHDRAVLHFLTTDSDRETYRRVLLEATRAGSAVLIGVFAPDGPDHCSGLPVRRQSVADLVAFLGEAFEPVATRREVHRTPADVAQPFSWIAARRRA